LRYGLSIALGVGALVLSQILPTIGVLKVSFVAFFTLLIGLSAWFGGLGPGLICTALCALGVADWLEPPRSLAIEAPEEVVGTIIFVIVGIGLSSLAEQLHRARRAERGAREAAERAAALERAAREMRDEMMAMVAHDLRTPLSAIRLSVAALDRRTQTSAGVDAWHERADALLRMVRRMNVMLNDLVDTAALDAGKLLVSPAPEPCAALLGETVSLFLPEAEQRAVRLAAEASGGSLQVLADHDRVLRVLENLTSNALKFTPKGGSITLAVEPAEGCVRFVVHDTGRGMNEAERSHVFERFARAPREQGGGTGLGLHIAKAIVEAHGGTMRVESAEARGSTFSFTLPSA
jgi:signal transduction histidine kinase